MHASGTAKVRSNDVRPLNPGFDLEQPSCLIEAADPTEATHIEQSAAAQELLVTGHAKLPICGQLNFPTLPGGRRAEHVGRGEAEGDDSATDPERVGGGYGRAGAMGAGSSDVLRGAGDDR